MLTLTRCAVAMKGSHCHGPDCVTVPRALTKIILAARTACSTSETLVIWICLCFFCTVKPNQIRSLPSVFFFIPCFYLCVQSSTDTSSHGDHSEDTEMS